MGRWHCPKPHCFTATVTKGNAIAVCNTDLQQQLPLSLRSVKTVPITPPLPPKQNKDKKTQKNRQTPISVSF